MSIDQTSSRSGDNTYVLGHVDAEIRRLLLQGRLYANFTDLDTLAQRLQEEAATAQAIVVMPPLICASTQHTYSEVNK